MKKSQTEPPLSSPIPFSNGSNGEFVPAVPGALARRREQLFRRLVDERARKLGVSRRRFIGSWCGIATSLYVLQLTGCGGSSSDGADGGFGVDSGSTWDANQACEALSGSEFIFDVQTHHVDPNGSWRTAGTAWPLIFQSFPQASCGESDPIDCYDANHYVREMFVNSDTAVAVLSAVPAVEDENPLVAQEQAETRALVEMLSGSPRLVTHGLVLPDLGQAQIDGMQALAEDLKIGAWKIYPQFGGWDLRDAEGVAFVDKAVQLGIKRVCAHKGLTLPGFGAAEADPADMAYMSTQYADVNFIVYHSGYETDTAEGAYDSANPTGVDRLIRAVEDFNVQPNTNLYAEIGSTWRDVSLRSGRDAEHVMGKLLKYIGEDNILWGTDSIWYGSPQDQIVAFRAFSIGEDLQSAHGYPALTQAIKEKIFGLNAARVYGIDPEQTLCEIRDDQLALRKRELPDRPALRMRDYGPTTRREFFAFLRQRDGQPG